MSKTRVQMIIETLRDNPSQKFTARDLAAEFLKRYPAEMAEKQNNPRYDTEEKLLVQLAAEIGGERTNIDWQSVNRIVSENTDFHRFIEQVGIYSQTGRLVKSVWNK